MRVTKLFFCQNDLLLGGSFWQKDSLVTFILFELNLLWYLAQSQILVTSLYYTLFYFLEILQAVTAQLELAAAQDRASVKLYLIYFNFEYFFFSSNYKVSILNSAIF